MAQVIFTGGLITSIRGKVGDLIYRQTPSGKTIVYKAPTKLTPRQISALEKKNHRRFVLMVKIVNCLSKDPDEQAAYEQKFKNKSKKPSLRAYLWKKVHEMLTK